MHPATSRSCTHALERQMPNKEDVQMFKSKPLTFMSTHVVIPTHSPIKSGRCAFTFETREGRDFCALEVAEEDDPEVSFEAYWCLYEEDKTLGVVVGADAKYMFTETMNGCSLGVGSKNSEGERYVAHANCASLGNLIYE